MNDNKVQKLSDDALDQVSGGGIGALPTSREEAEAEIAQLEAEIAQLEALPPMRKASAYGKIGDKKMRMRMLKDMLNTLKW